MFKSTNEIKKSYELEIGVLKAAGYDGQTAIKLIGNGTQVYEFDYFKDNYKEIVTDEEYLEEIQKMLDTKKPCDEYWLIFNYNNDNYVVSLAL